MGSRKDRFLVQGPIYSAMLFFVHHPKRCDALECGHITLEPCQAELMLSGVLGRRYQTELSETALGHSKLSELLRGISADEGRGTAYNQEPK